MGVVEKTSEAILINGGWPMRSEPLRGKRFSKPYSYALFIPFANN